MLGYALKALCARKARAAAILTGFALSFATVIFSYAVASNVQLASSQALRFVVGNSTLWIAPQGSPSIDPHTQTLVQQGQLDGALVEELADNAEVHMRRVAIERRQTHGVAYTVYWDSDFVGEASISRNLIEVLPEKPVTIGGAVLQTAQMREDLPGLLVVLPAHNRERPPGWTWLLLDQSDPASWARSFADENNFMLADTAVQTSSGTANGTVYLLSSSLSRFDPFSFQTKFAAWQLNAVTSSLLGWLARIVFLFGAVMVISSSRISVAERRAEVAALTVLGYQSDFTILLLIENAILLLLSLPIAILVGLALAALALPAGDLTSSIASSAGLTVFFLPIVLIAAALWAGQYVAGKSEVSLVRSEY